MTAGYTVSVIIPALNEEAALPLVLAEIPDWVHRIIVVDNGSSDATSIVARDAGAEVVWEPKRGYGSACLAGLREVRDEDIIVFLDADYSDFPSEISLLIDPIACGRADFVVGSRILGGASLGVLTWPQWFGNRLACGIMRLVWNGSFTDLGPFRAIKRTSLEALMMSDPNYGWTVEMQIKALLHKMPYAEVPVRYRNRVGSSKISGTVRGTLAAGSKILWVLFGAVLSHRLRRARITKRSRGIVRS